MPRIALPWFRMRVSGASMVPTLRHRDVILVRRGARVTPGTVVVGQFRDLPGRDVVKRAVAPAPSGWDLRSDNPFTEGDSRSHGPGNVHGRVVLVWRADARGARRFVPQRVR